MSHGGKRIGAGRKKGSVNKKSQALSELLEEAYPDYDPVLQLAGIAQDEGVEMSLRIQAAKEVAKYTHPQLRAVDVNASVQGVVEIDWGED